MLKLGRARASTLGLAFALALAAHPLPAQVAESRDQSDLQRILQSRLSEIQSEASVPGVAVGVALADGSSFGLAAGLADTSQGVAMTPVARLMQGSVGKTYVAAVALQLVAEGSLDLDARVAKYLGEELWYRRLPNHGEITVRQLMNHTSGLVRYEFDDRFISDLLAEPDRIWRPEELLAYLFDNEAPFAAGESWEYSDTNYIVLGLIIERLTGNAYYDELRKRILEPLGLRNTVPTDSRRVPGLVQGYAGVENPFQLPEAVIVDGQFAINPQFEWTGGGIASTAEDLARWGWLLYEGRAFDPALLPTMLEAVDAKLGPNVKYGLGVIVRPTPLGISWGHSGFFPGYLAEMAYFPEHRLCLALQVNSSDFGTIQTGPSAILRELARIVIGDTRQSR